MKVVFALFALFVAFCVAENDIYMGGDFLLTIEQDDGSLDHIASLVSYSPDEDVYYDTFEGGVFRASGFLTLLKETPLGMYGTGVFTFVDDDHDYTNSVIRYNNDDDDFETVHDGIYLRNGDSVRYIAGTKDNTFFAGSFNSVEYITRDGEEEVVVPNIAMVDENEDWALLDNPDSVFPADPYISGLTATDDTAFIYARNGEGAADMYTWDSDNNYQALGLSSDIELMGTGIFADSLGNVAGVSLTAAVTGQGGEYSLIILNAENSYASSTHFLYNSVDACSGNPRISGDPIVVPFMDGFLIAYPSAADNCNIFTWALFNSTTMQLTNPYNAIPSVDEIDFMIQGDSGDLWVATTASSSILYLPDGGTQWIQVDLSAFGTFTVSAMEWDNGPDKLLVYGSTPTGMELIEVKTDSFPPMVKKKSPGTLFNPGTVTSLAVMNDADDDDYELYIGGTFDSIGNKHEYSNFVRWKAGSYDSPLPNLPPINALSANGYTIFYATSICVDNGEQLPIGYYNKDTEDFDVWVTVPTMIGSAGCVTAITATDEYVFVGGAFSVQLPNAATGHAVIYFNRLTSEWHEIGIPTTINSTLAYYEISSLDVATVDGYVYLAIGGHFDFVVGSTEYHSFAMYDLSSGQWLTNQGLEFATDTIVNSLVIDDIESVYIAGDLLLSNGGSESGVFVYDVNANTYSAIGNLPTSAESILLNTVEEDDNDITYVFAGGNFNNVTQHTGLGYTQSTSGPTVPWTQAGPTSQFFQYYRGDVNALLYTTGGVGANDTNGYDPGYTPVYVGPNESSGMSAWGMVFLILFLIVCAVAVVALVSGGGFIYWKKRQNYQAV